MLLRTRVTLIVSFTYCLLVGGLVFAGWKSEELADERYSQATLNGQEIFWRKLVENAVQRLETDANTISADSRLVEAVERRDPTAVLVAVGPIAEALKARNSIARFEVMTRDGELLYSSRSLLEPATIDAGTLRGIVDSHRPIRGVIQDANRTFTATLAFPLEGEKDVVGVAVLAADLRPPLMEFKASTGSDIFLVDHSGHMAVGTDDGLWQNFAGKVSARKSRMETREEGGRFYSMVVLPLHDGVGRVIGALVTARDFTATQSRQNLIRKVSMGAVAGFLVLVLGLFTVYLRRSFHPLNEAIAVLNALSRGDTSVSLEVRNEQDEIGRIAGTVGVFRENTIKLDLMQQRRERQRRRQELFIRMQMQGLSEMLEEEARAAVLADLRQIEELASRKSDADDDHGSGKGELEVLGVAFQTMSDRIREQHESLQALIAERTRDVEVLREALRTRDQLAALRQELDFARELQLSSLPQVFPPFPDRHEFQIHASMVPAKEVGGDFYDFFLIDRSHLAFVIGDASGKGVPAAMFIAITRSLIKAVAPLSSTPGECMAFVNTMLAADNPQTLFATCFYAVLDVRTGEVAFCNAGHPPPLIQRADGTVEAIRDVSGVALGVMEDLDYDTGSFQLSPGDTVLLYTDGVTEAQDMSEALYEEYRLIDRLGQLGQLEPSEVIARVQSAVEGFVGDAPQFDDITMLSLRFDQPSEAGDDADEPQRRLTLTGFKPAPEPAPVPQRVAPPPVARPKVTAQPAGGSQPLVIQLGPIRAKMRPANPESAETPAEVPPTAPPVPVPAPEPEPEVAVPRAHLDVTIGNDLDELGRLAAVVDDFVEKNGLPERISFNLNLCLDELITNIVSYGYDNDQHHDIHVRLGLEDGVLMCQIIDDAKEYDPFVEAPEPDLDAEVDDRPIGGLGVFLVKEFMDRTEYRREGDRNVVTLWKNT
ncbi:MAG: SpoIIE family protein phosphatase [Magnetospirillum sp.]|nr:SpoIIE family protein phosphatase [Magnetospirillum sp.]